MLRALREARGATQEGWAARLGVGRVTVQRWERGERVPDPGAESAILAYCRDGGLFRAYDRGPLAGVTLSAEVLQDLLAEGRWQLGGGQPTGDPLPPAEGAEQPTRMSGPALTLPPTNLPVQLTSFVGREQEIAAVRRVQAGTRLLTLTGTGGCGKTRLAVAAAVEVLWAYPSGVWFVDLAPLPGPPRGQPGIAASPPAFDTLALVSQTVAATLQIQTTGRHPITETLITALKPRRLLLVLDNCEHLLPACAELAVTLLRACPKLEIMATSREVLGISGETIWRVPPMALPESGNRGRGLAVGVGIPAPSPSIPAPHPPADAVRLFVERARLQWPEWAPAPDEVEAVAALCRRLDGMPLAIELAAARIAALTVEQIAERLDDRFGLLTSGGRGAVPRHQTLLAAMDWSHDLLTGPEQVVLRRLAVFAGGFTLEAAEAISGAGHEESGQRERRDSRLYPMPPSDVLDLLAQLVGKSLVIAERQGEAVRYRLLETVRQYAQQKLDDAEESAVVRERHHDWCLTLAATAEREFYGPRESEWLARLESEHDNLRIALLWSLGSGQQVGERALRLAAALERFWDVRGHLSEGRQWLARLLAAAGEAATAARAVALRGAGNLAFHQGDLTAAHALMTECLLLCRELEDAGGVADAEAMLGKIACRRGDYDHARAFLEASLTHGRGQGDQLVMATAYANLGVIALWQGEYDRAHTCIEASLAIHRALGNKQGIAVILDDVATLAAERGDGERAKAALEESLKLFRELGNPSGVALMLGDLGMRAWQQGERERGAALVQESVDLYRALGERTGIARVLGYQSAIALFQRQYDVAEERAGECLTLYRETGDLWAIGRFLPVLAGARFACGQAEQAASLMAGAAALRERASTRLPVAFQSVHDRTIDALRRSLGDQRFTAAWAAGAAAPIEDALAGALSGDLPA